MAELIWTEPALGDLDAIADYIALDKPDAAKKLVLRILNMSNNFKITLKAAPNLLNFEACLTARLSNRLVAFFIDMMVNEYLFFTS